MSDDKVVKLRPGSEPDEVLELAKGHYEKVLVLGFTPDGDLSAWSSTNANFAELLWMLETFKLMLLDGDLEE